MARHHRTISQYLSQIVLLFETNKSIRSNVFAGINFQRMIKVLSYMMRDDVE